MSINIKKFIKSCTDNLIKLFYNLFEILFFILPIVIIIIIAIQFYSISLDKKPSSEQYNILLVAIGITATLSGLSFRAGSLCQNNDKKINFYHQGLRLFHGTMLFIFSVPLSFIYNEINLTNKFALIGSLNNHLNTASLFIDKFINNICFIFAQFFFTYGLYLTQSAFIELNRILWKEKLLDNKVKKEFFE